MKTATLALSISLLAASAAVHADPTSIIPNLMDIAKDAKGNWLEMDQYQADRYCQKQGTRLPTIQELALWATQYGAQFSKTPLPGFDEISGEFDGIDSAVNSNTFYYLSSGYKAPSEVLGWYWSSSPVLGEPSGVYYLNSNDGGIYADQPTGSYIGYVVRCLQSR